MKLPLDDDPTVERPVPDALVAAARDDDFRTGRVTFAEVMAKLGPCDLGGPPSPARDEVAATGGGPTEEARALDELDDAWGEQELPTVPIVTLDTRP